MFKKNYNFGKKKIIFCRNVIFNQRINFRFVETTISTEFAIFITLKCNISYLPYRNFGINKKNLDKNQAKKLIMHIVAVQC